MGLVGDGEGKMVEGWAGGGGKSEGVEGVVGARHGV